MDRLAVYRRDGCGIGSVSSSRWWNPRQDRLELEAAACRVSCVGNFRSGAGAAARRGRALAAGRPLRILCTRRAASADPDPAGRRPRPDPRHAHRGKPADDRQDADRGRHPTRTWRMSVAPRNGATDQPRHELTRARTNGLPELGSRCVAQVRTGYIVEASDGHRRSRPVKHDRRNGETIEKEATGSAPGLGSVRSWGWIQPLECESPRPRGASEPT